MTPGGVEATLRPALLGTRGDVRRDGEAVKQSIGMSVRLEMLQVARLAPQLLGDSTGLVRDFLLRQHNPDGGFRDRDGRSDLYYTVFGLEGLLALQIPLPTAAVKSYLDSFGDGTGLDFVHLCCLARGRAALRIAPAENPAWQTVMAERLERFRSADGGYHVQPGSKAGTSYGNFMAAAAFQDLERAPPEPRQLHASMTALATPDGAWSNERGLPTGATNATAAAITLLRQIGQPIDPRAGDWLLACWHPQGGFRATPAAPLPDLLSTATALHALAGLEKSFAPQQEACLNFVDTLWSNEGGFHGHWGDDFLDVEYTYYGLLALGHLSLSTVQGP